MIDQANAQLSVTGHQSFDQSPVLNLEIIWKPQRASHIFGQAGFERAHFVTRQPLHIESFALLPPVTVTKLSFLFLSQGHVKRAGDVEFHVNA
jgi:hypothetical protein